MYRRFATKWIAEWPLPQPRLSEKIPNSPEFVSFATKCMIPVRKALEDWADWVRQRERSGNCIQRCEVTYTILPKKAPNGQRTMLVDEDGFEKADKNGDKTKAGAREGPLETS
ncbi:hypothetical protein AX14_005700 [Amanita brunnescens Koide BX004]|nr:hypothetical protein AX14_005700 [Amanita brunnescens Koide BX004]